MENTSMVEFVIDLVKMYVSAFSKVWDNDEKHGCLQQ